LQDCLTKNPKKRPAARKMLEHPHMLAMELGKRLAVELLQQVGANQTNLIFTNRICR
jgi:hypothetical protein